MNAPSYDNGKYTHSHVIQNIHLTGPHPSRSIHKKVLNYKKKLHYYRKKNVFIDEQYTMFSRRKIYGV